METSDQLNEKAKSKTQQRLFGMVTAYKSGKLDLDTLDDSLAKKIKSIAYGERKKTGDKRKFTKGMSKEAAKDYAKTKHTDLPEKVQERVKVTEDNKDKIVDRLVDVTDYTMAQLNRLTLRQLDSLYNDDMDVDDIIGELDVAELAAAYETKIKRFADFLNEQEQYLEGGTADGKSLEDIAAMHQVPVEYFYKILPAAIEIEKEHTDDDKLCEEIVKSHLIESPLYYHEKHGLPAMEQNLENMDKEEVDEIISTQVQGEQKIKKFNEFDKK